MRNGRGSGGPGILGCGALLLIIVVLGLVGSGIYAAIVFIPQWVNQNKEQAAYSATATAFAPYSSIGYSALNATLSGSATITYDQSGQGGVSLTHNGGSVTFKNVSVPQTGSYHLIAWGSLQSATFDITVNGTVQATSSINLPSIQGGESIQLNSGYNTIELSVASFCLTNCSAWITSIQIEP